MSLTKFENRRWSSAPPKSEIAFRHRAALSFADRGPVIDLGCGNGIFLQLLKEKNIAVEGVDISDEAVAACRRDGLTVVKYDLEEGKLPYEDNKFAFAVILDNLEHLFNPSELLVEAKRVAEGIIISVPNFSSLPARLQMFCGRVPENNTPNKGHRYWFNYYILSDMVNGLNLKIEDIKMNTIWEDKFIIGKLMKFLCRVWPNLFALSFVVKLKNEKNT